jgi:hypothetical protein
MSTIRVPTCFGVFEHLPAFRPAQTLWRSRSNAYELSNSGLISLFVEGAGIACLATAHCGLSAVEQGSYSKDNAPGARPAFGGLAESSGAT